MKYDLHNHTLDVAVEVLATLYKVEPEDIVTWSVRKFMADWNEMFGAMPAEDK